MSSTVPPASRAISTTRSSGSYPSGVAATNSIPSFAQATISDAQTLLPSPR